MSDSKLMHASRVPLSAFDEFEALLAGKCLEQPELPPAAQLREERDARRHEMQAKREQGMKEFRQQFAKWLEPGVDKLEDYMRGL